jgi:hypothetical protein
MPSNRGGSGTIEESLSDTWRMDGRKRRLVRDGGLPDGMMRDDGDGCDGITASGTGKHVPPLSAIYIDVRLIRSHDVIDSGLSPFGPGGRVSLFKMDNPECVSLPRCRLQVCCVSHLPCP